MNCTCGKDLGVGHDGERRVCHCGKKWVCVVEGGLGVYFVPDVKPDHSTTAVHKRMQKRKVEAQKVWYERRSR